MDCANLSRALAIQLAIFRMGDLTLDRAWWRFDCYRSVMALNDIGSLDLLGKMVSWCRPMTYIGV
jgi:hypothetical protein